MTENDPKIIDHDPTDGHAHGEAEGEHTHGDDEVNYTPQPVAMQILSNVVALSDGSTSVVITFNSVNGSWTAFFDTDGAINLAQTLLRLAYTPPQIGTAAEDDEAAPDDAAELAPAV